MDNRRRMMWKKPQINAIYYTSKDGKVINVNSTTDWGGAKLVSNTYKNGQGVMLFDKPVTKVKGFSSKYNLLTIELPDSVLTIDGRAFSQCVQLQSINIPENVTDIGSSAFENCPALAEVHITNLANWCNINFIGATSNPICKCGQLYVNGILLTDFQAPSSVTSIKKYAFYQCKLTTIIIPEHITTIGNSAFYGCPTQTINVGKNVKNFGSHAFGKCTGEAYLNCNIPDYGCQYHQFTKIVIGDDVTSIGKYAFDNGSSIGGWTGLQTTVISSNITSWGKCAFGACTGELSVASSTPNSNGSSEAPFYSAKFTKIVVNGRQIGNYTFYGNTALANVTIGNSVTSIGDWAFSGCTSLTSVTIGNSVTSIGDYVFNNCSALNTINMPSSITFIGENPFYNCTALPVTDSIQYADTYLVKAAVTSNTYYNIKSNTRWIGRVAFKNCTNLTSIEIPNSVVSIETAAFYGCSALTTITISDNVTAISEQMFYNCKKLATVNMPSEITTIKDSAFYNCYELNTIIPSNVTTIENSAFRGCSKLNCSIPNKVTSIGNHAFYGCSKFKNLVIPDSVISIGYGAFQGVYCTSITLGNNVEFIRGQAFMGSPISSLILPNSLKSIGSNAFAENHLITVTIPDNVIEIEGNPFNGNMLQGYYGKYATADHSSIIIDNIFVAMAASCGLTTYTIPTTVTTIGLIAFSNCTSLRSVTIPDSVTEIERSAFSGCSALQNIISLNTTAPTIASDTFWGISSGGTLIHPLYSDYSSWMQTGDRYLGDYNWTSQYAYTPQTYSNLLITAQNVSGRDTTTTISWTCMSDGVDTITGEPMAGIQLSGTATSEEFPQNTSETETVERTITFEYQGLTASTTITQGIWIKQSYELVLNDNWQLSTDVANPDSTLYDGVYESFSNYNKNSTAAIMYIDINGYETFQLYIRSYAESSYDYVMVSQIDQTIDNNSSYSNTTLVKAHTRGTQKSGTAISDYTLVEFTGLDGGEHRITVVYRKDGSGNSGTDKGYLIIPRQ